MDAPRQICIVRVEDMADIFRTKGILAIAGSSCKCVYQGVHMIFNSDWGDAWAEGEPRESKLVVIGKNLDQDELQAGFRNCLSTRRRSGFWWGARTGVSKRE